MRILLQSSPDLLGQNLAFFVDRNAIHDMVCAIFKVILVAQSKQYIIERLFLKSKTYLAEAGPVSMYLLKDL